MTRHVAVLMGGWNSERDVSLVSGRECADALEESGYRVSRIDVGRDIPRVLMDLAPRPDVVFNALHGRWGEDGCIQGLLEILGIPYTHSGPLASALAMNKHAAKRLFLDVGIPCPDGAIVQRDAVGQSAPYDPPFVVKPNNEGSSVGVRIVEEGSNDDRLLADDFRYGDEALVERFVRGREITVAVMGDRALGVTEVCPREGFFDYEHKYTDGASEHLIPAPIPDDAYRDAGDYALRAHQALGCRGISRADLRFDDSAGESGRLYMLEVNTQPGMTPISLVPEQARHCGIGFAELVSWMVEAARCDD